MHKEKQKDVNRKTQNLSFVLKLIISLFDYDWFNLRTY